MLIIPNATDTTGGNKYAALDQAEPDSLDFEILGNVGSSGVVSGLAVTSNSSTTTVNVAAGVIALNGSAYSVIAAPTYALPSAPIDNRFDLIVARVTAGTASLVTISGTNDPTNPRFPQSRSVITGVYNSSTNVDLATDVVIAAIYRSASAVITTSRILDKRAIITSGISFQGTTAPASSIGAGPGNLYFKSDTVDDAGTASGIYVKLASGSWISVAKDIGPHVPIGAEIIWPTKAAVPSRFLEPTGQSLSTTTYATLFAVYGYENGGSGGTFLMPDHRNVHLRSTDNTALVTAGVGADNVFLSIAQLPPHDHANSHTHTFPHTHGIDHVHTGTLSPAGSHQHSPGTLSITGSGGRNIAFREPSYPPSGPAYITGYVADVSGGYPAPLNGGMVLSNTVDTLVTSGLTSVVAAHTHTITFDPFTGSTVSQSTATTGASYPTTTSSTGSGSAVSVIPASKYVRHIIRVS